MSALHRARDKGPCAGTMNRNAESLAARLDPFAAEAEDGTLQATAVSRMMILVDLSVVLIFLLFYVILIDRITIVERFRVRRIFHITCAPEQLNLIVSNRDV